MARFSELSEQDKIQSIKDEFILILEQLVKDPAKLKEYIKLEQPKLVVAALESIKETMTDDEKKVAQEHNNAITAQVAEENKKIEALFKEKEEAYKKAEELILKIGKREACTCGTCLDNKITVSVIPKELEGILAAARKGAEERQY